MPLMKQVNKATSKFISIVYVQFFFIHVSHKIPIQRQSSSKDVKFIVTTRLIYVILNDGTQYNLRNRVPCKRAFKNDCINNNLKSGFGHWFARKPRFLPLFLLLLLSLSSTRKIN